MRDRWLSRAQRFKSNTKITSNVYASVKSDLLGIMHSYCLLTIFLLFVFGFWIISIKVAVMN